MSADKKTGLTHIGELLPGFEQLKAMQLKAIKPPPEPKALTIQGKHHFTRIKQIDALAGIADDPNADMGFMARLLTLCSLPRTNPGTRLQYKRQNGPYKLIMIAGGDNKLPYGNLPRLLLAWVCTEAVRTQEQKLILGNSLTAFMRDLGMYSDSGGSRGDRTRLKHQIDRLFNCHVDLIYEDKTTKVSTGGRFAPQTVLWWDYHRPEQDTLWQSWILLGEELFKEIIAHPVPLDMRILKAMRRSPLGLDLYMWLSYKTFTLYSQKKKPEFLSWNRLYRQFGSNPELADDHRTVQNFRQDVLRELQKLKTCWPALNFTTPKGCLEIRGCPPSVSPKAIGR
jgi:hypothetical protein